MKDRFGSRDLLLAFVSVGLLSFTGCSYTTNFVVINASDQAIEVRYVIKRPAGPVPPSEILPTLPAIKATSQLDQQVAWMELSASQYSIDFGKRTAVVSLMPGYALRVEHRNLVDQPQDEVHQSANFGIEEIDIIGSKGEIHLTGEEARRSFVPESKSVYTITYRQVESDSILALLRYYAATTGSDLVLPPKE